MRVVFISGTPVAPDPRLEKEAKSLCKNGYAIQVLAWDRTKKYNKTEKTENYTIHRFKFRSPSGRQIAFLFMPIWWIYEFFWLLINDWDIAHSIDFVTIIPATIAAKIKRKHVVYDIFDLYADMAPPSTPKILKRVISWFERLMIRSADGVIFVDESKHYLSLIDDKNKLFTVVKNSPEDALVNPILNIQKQRTEFKIFYAGHLAEERGFSKMISAISNLENVRLIIAGFGKDEMKLRSVFERTKNLEFIGQIPYSSVIQLSIQSDLLFALYDPSISNHMHANPNKLFEAMMCAKPILVNKGTRMAEIVENEQCGIIVDYNDVGTIREAIIKLRDDKDLCIKLGSNGRLAYEKRYNWGIMEGRLLDLYLSIRSNQQ